MECVIVLAVGRLCLSGGEMRAELDLELNDSWQFYQWVQGRSDLLHTPFLSLSAVFITEPSGSVFNIDSLVLACCILPMQIPHILQEDDNTDVVCSQSPCPLSETGHVYCLPRQTQRVGPVPLSRSLCLKLCSGSALCCVCRLLSLGGSCCVQGCAQGG